MYLACVCLETILSGEYYSFLYGYCYTMCIRILYILPAPRDTCSLYCTAYMYIQLTYDKTTYMISLRLLILDDVKVWTTKSNVFGARNTEGTTRYFSDREDAAKFAGGTIKGPHPGRALAKVTYKRKKEKKVDDKPTIDENTGEMVTCSKCGWAWKLSDGGQDPFICHKCGHDNTKTNNPRR